MKLDPHRVQRARDSTRAHKRGRQPPLLGHTAAAALSLSALATLAAAAAAAVAAAGRGAGVADVWLAVGGGAEERELPPCAHLVLGRLCGDVGEIAGRCGEI